MAESPPVTLRQAAADELALQLTKVADELVGRGLRPRRVTYGRGSVSGLIKPRSPRGFVLDAVAPQLLLPDGRLWYYHSRRSPEGIYFDARVDHERSHHGSIPLGGNRFSFLGAVVRRYNFGYRHEDDRADGSWYELGAIISRDGSTEFVDADDALAEIIADL